MIKGYVYDFEFGREIGVQVRSRPEQRGDREAILRPDPDRPTRLRWVDDNEDANVLREFSEVATFTCGHREAREIYLALDNFYRRQGRPPESDAKRDGRLEATERHLDDMRRLALRNIRPIEEDK